MSSSAEQIKDRLSIVEVVSSYLKLERAGSNFKARCPFHNERTPSFFVSPSRQSFHCFGCGKSGDIFTFVEEIEGLSFIESLKLLADRAGVKLPDYRGGQAAEDQRARLRQILEEAVRFYKANLKPESPAQRYLLERGLKPETIDLHSLGFAPAGWRNLSAHLKVKGFGDKEIVEAGLAIAAGGGGIYDRFRGRIMFPLYDYSGKVVGFSGRIMPGAKEEEGGKYINTPQTAVYDKSKILYGLDKAKPALRQSDRAILVEGQMDVLLAHQSGSLNTAGLSGTALSERHLELIRRLTDNLVLILDGDEAGFAASGRTVRLVLSSGMNVSVAVLPENSDPADLIARDGRQWFSLVEAAKPFVDFALEVLGRRNLPAREFFQLIRRELFPYLAEMRGNLERDEALKKIAGLTENSVDALRADYNNWLLSYRPGEPVPSGQVKLSVSRPSRDILVRRLAGLILWQEGLETAQLDRSRLVKLLGQAKLNELFGSLLDKSDELDRNLLAQQEELIFQAEALYVGFKAQALEEELSNLARRLKAELLREELEEALTNLRRAEREHDEKRADEFLKKCQSISRELNLYSQNQRERSYVKKY